MVRALVSLMGPPAGERSSRGIPHRARPAIYPRPSPTAPAAILSSGHVPTDRLLSIRASSGTPPPMRHFVLGTAGHVDHGKTTLVRALTGVDTDRLPEEKQRGISIELGFAPLDLGDGVRASVIDVPGHRKLVR